MKALAVILVLSFALVAGMLNVHAMPPDGGPEATCESDRGDCYFYVTLAAATACPLTGTSSWTCTDIVHLYHTCDSSYLLCTLRRTIGSL